MHPPEPSRGPPERPVFLLLSNLITSHRDSLPTLSLKGDAAPGQEAAGPDRFWDAVIQQNSSLTALARLTAPAGRAGLVGLEKASARVYSAALSSGSAASVSCMTAAANLWVLLRSHRCGAIAAWADLRASGCSLRCVSAISAVSSSSRTAAIAARCTAIIVCTL